MRGQENAARIAKDYSGAKTNKFWFLKISIFPTGPGRTGPKVNIPVLFTLHRASMVIYTCNYPFFRKMQSYNVIREMPL